MILPTNGKVVILDDEYNEVAGLLKALSKKKIPYHYYQDETGEDLPESPIENVRLIFLDLELISGQKIPDHSIISTIGVRLERILEPKNNYILIYWSTKEKKYKELVDNAFENGLNDYKPIITISLNKAKALKQGDNIVDFIIQEIENKSEGFSLFKVFALWENLVNDSAGDLINDFIDFIGKDSDWDDNAKYVLYKLAQAYSGKTINEKTETEKLKDSFYTLNHTLIDTIEGVIPKRIDEKQGKLNEIISDEQKGKDDYISLINSKLLFSESQDKGIVPGSLFFINDEIEQKKIDSSAKLEKFKSNDKIPADKRASAIEKATKAHLDDIKNLEGFSKSVKKNFGVMINDIINPENEAERKGLRDAILESSIKIELNISPICDYAQEKMKCARLVPGILIKSEFKEMVNSKNAFNYFSDCKIRHEKEDYYLVFDFRFLHSKPEAIIKKRPSYKKLRHQLLSDIQIKLGSHINRSGVIYLS